jgi:hypothetical protein
VRKLRGRKRGRARARARARARVDEQRGRINERSSGEKQYRHFRRARKSNLIQF